jgi:hypothetical protein
MFIFIYFSILNFEKKRWRCLKEMRNEKIISWVTFQRKNLSFLLLSFLLLTDFIKYVFKVFLDENKLENRILNPKNPSLHFSRNHSGGRTLGYDPVNCASSATIENVSFVIFFLKKEKLRSRQPVIRLLTKKKKIFLKTMCLSFFCTRPSHARPLKPTHFDSCFFFFFF